MSENDRKGLREVSDTAYMALWFGFSCYLLTLLRYGVLHAVRVSSAGVFFDVCNGALSRNQAFRLNYTSRSLVVMRYNRRDMVEIRAAIVHWQTLFIPHFGLYDTQKLPPVV